MTNDYGDVPWKDKLSSPGVLEVTIPVKLNQSTQSVMRANVAKEVEDTLGFRLPGPFSNVAFVVEDCWEVENDKCGWAGTCDIGLTIPKGESNSRSHFIFSVSSAYAFINHWLSVFVQDNWRYPAVTMHELGHNLGLVRHPTPKLFDV